MNRHNCCEGCDLIESASAKGIFILGPRGGPSLEQGCGLSEVQREMLAELLKPPKQEQGQLLD
jgi:hypothetical protein